MNRTLPRTCFQEKGSSKIVLVEEITTEDRQAEQPGTRHTKGPGVLEPVTLIIGDIMTIMEADGEKDLLVQHKLASIKLQCRRVLSQEEIKEADSLGEVIKEIQEVPLAVVVEVV